MSSKTSKLNDSKLLECVILGKKSSRWKQEYDLKGIDKDSKSNDVQTFLYTCEEYFSSNHDGNFERRSDRNSTDNRNPEGHNRNGNSRTGGG